METNKTIVFNFSRAAVPCSLPRKNIPKLEAVNRRHYLASLMLLQELNDKTYDGLDMQLPRNKKLLQRRKWEWIKIKTC
jgi:hypothetical protein